MFNNVDFKVTALNAARNVGRVYDEIKQWGLC